MEETVHAFFEDCSSPVLFGIIAATLAVLGKSADWLVGEAVVLSERSGLPKVVIGATIVSMGTTSPEAVVSVLAALQGNPGLALGNAVGSIICDTGLILGLACLIGPLPLLRSVVNRQGWIQLGAGVLLVLACLPYTRPQDLFTSGSTLPQFAGVAFVVLLVAYLGLSVRWARQQGGEVSLEEFEEDVRAPVAYVVGKLIVAIALVVASSWVLIPAVEVAAERLKVPSGVIAATLVAFGTSLPELVTAVTASWRGHGDLAVGNVVGADILNVLFVAGVAAAVTPGGLGVSPDFFRVLFPAMLVVLVTFRLGITFSGDHLRRSFGAVLLAVYLITLVLSYATLQQTAES